MAKKKNALGRGLGALLSDSGTSIESKVESREESASGSIELINLENIEVNPFQPRSTFDETALNELAESIKIHGIIQPITVRKLSGKSFQLISGERRFQASKRAGLTEVPVYVRLADDQQMLEMALIENIQRENLNAIEIALSYQRLLSECELKQEELGERVGKSRATVTNYLRLLKLPPDIQIGLRDKQITMGHARALISVEDTSVQLTAFRKTVAEDLSVRQVESLVRALSKGGNEKKDTSDKPEPNKEFDKLKSRLTSHFESNISIKTDGKKGEIKIPFVSIEDLNRILEILDL
ncbi:MAG: ParB/RepB/Spo0J family partition protein [Cyclobacteriaceae bacterium]|nr:ParB/RepB/Spo0J family partition protein [Cyclobacteriaceae bacterium]